MQVAGKTNTKGHAFMRSWVVGQRGPIMPGSRFDPWRADKTRRQVAKRRAEGRWDGCSDPARMAAAIAHNQHVERERSLMTAQEVASAAMVPGWRGARARGEVRANDLDAKQALRERRNAAARARRAAKKAAA